LIDNLLNNDKYKLQHQAPVTRGFLFVGLILIFYIVIIDKL